MRIDISASDHRFLKATAVPSASVLPIFKLYIQENRLEWLQSQNISHCEEKIFKSTPF